MRSTLSQLNGVVWRYYTAMDMTSTILLLWIDFFALLFLARFILSWYSRLHLEQRQSPSSTPPWRIHFIHLFLSFISYLFWQSNRWREGSASWTIITNNHFIYFVLKFMTAFFTMPPVYFNFVFHDCTPNKLASTFPRFEISLVKKYALLAFV